LEPLTPILLEGEAQGRAWRGWGRGEGEREARKSESCGEEAAERGLRRECSYRDQRIAK
jgi:hypothetical protein